MRTLSELFYYSVETYRKPDHLIEDAMIAATAAVNGLTVVTRNVRDFEGFGVKVVDPFKNS